MIVIDQLLSISDSELKHLVSSRSFDVLLGDERVGWLAEDTNGRISFRFSPTYLKVPSRPVLSQSFEDDLKSTYSGRRPGELPAFFGNLLPEGRFREVLEKSVGIAEDDDLGLLAAVASDLPGAVSLVSSSEPAPSSNGTSERTDAGAAHDERTEGAGLEFRFSLAGVQLKFSMVRREGKLALPAHGERGNWIVKVGSTEYPGLAENEFSMLQWAKRAEFEVPESSLLTAEEVPRIKAYIPDGSRVLAIERYDRVGGRRIHQEDFMQVFGWAPRREQKYASTYEELAIVVYALLGEAGYEEVIRRLALALAIGNNDAHLKNWSLLYRDPMMPTLSPVYDQVATVAWPTLDRALALKMAGSREFSRVSADSFARLARKVDVSPERGIELAQATLSQLQAKWKEIRAGMPIPGDHIAAIEDHWDRVPLLRSMGGLRA